MANSFVISDTHFNHANILGFKDSEGNLIRNFSDVYDMNETMIERWNSVIKPGDKVYHLGDVYFGSDDEYIHSILKRLNGKKKLIVGNHDSWHKIDKVLRYHFYKIEMWKKWTEKGFLFTHVPVHPSVLTESRFTGKKIRNIHGHIHQNNSPDFQYRNVCVEKTDYFPLSIEEL